MTNIQSTLYGTFPIGDINNAYTSSWLGCESRPNYEP